MLFRSADLEKHPINIVMHSLRDPSRAPSGRNCLGLEAWVPYNYVEDWKVEEEAIADKLIAKAEKVIPGLKERIAFKAIFSPLTYEQNTLSSQGAIGWYPTPGSKPRSQKTPIKNLLQAGQ